jgi:hypothetical protein
VSLGSPVRRLNNVFNPIQGVQASFFSTTYYDQSLFCKRTMLVFDSNVDSVRRIFMKKAMAALCMLMSMCFITGLSCAAAPPVIVTHALTGSSKEGTKTTLIFTVRVVNLGDAPIISLTLFLVPLPPLTPGQTTLNVATLGPHQSMDIPMQVTAPALLNADEISHMTLLWAGKCVDAQGTPVEFPATSHTEGAQ